MKIVEGMHKKIKLKQHDDKSVVIHLKNHFFDVLPYLHFLKFAVLRTGTRTRTFAS